MRSRLIGALAAVACVLGFGLIAATPAAAVSPDSGSVQAWNCRQVVASDVRFFRYSTGHETTYPHYLLRGERFKSHGVADGRYFAEFRFNPGGNSYWGFVTGDSSWVQQVPDSYCAW